MFSSKEIPYHTQGQNRRCENKIQILSSIAEENSERHERAHG